MTGGNSVSNYRLNANMDKPKTIPKVVQNWELGLISGDEAMNFIVKLLEEKTE